MRDMFTKLFTSVIIHVHVCVSKGQTILSLQWTQPWEDKTQKFWIYNLICCVKKKSHFLERWSKHVPHWPHDMCFQAHVLIHQRKIDNDLRKEITKAAILYPTMHFVSSRTQTFIQQENFLPVQFLIPLP